MLVFGIQGLGGLGKVSVVIQWPLSPASTLRHAHLVVEGFGSR